MQISIRQGKWYIWFEWFVWAQLSLDITRVKYFNGETILKVLFFPPLEKGNSMKSVSPNVLDNQAQLVSKKMI